MSVYSLDKNLAQQIVERTMDIIGCNVNIMDAKGRIIASGDEERIGETHDGALLALSQERTVDIDEQITKNLHCSSGHQFALTLRWRNGRRNRPDRRAG